MKLGHKRTDPATRIERAARVTARTVRDRMPERLRERIMPRKPSKLRQALPIVGAGAAGALAALLLDPARGRARRAKIRDMSAGMVRRVGRRAERRTRKISSDVYGMRQKMAHGLGDSEAPSLNDSTLAHKVESEVLGDPEFRGADVVVNAEDGVVVLRGQLDRPDQIRRLEKEVGELPGVARVENLLHLKGTLAPNKREAVEASREAARSRPV